MQDPGHIEQEYDIDLMIIMGEAKDMSDQERTFTYKNHVTHKGHPSHSRRLLLKTDIKNQQGTNNR